MSKIHGFNEISKHRYFKCKKQDDFSKPRMTVYVDRKNCPFSYTYLQPLTAARPDVDRSSCKRTHCPRVHGVAENFVYKEVERTRPAYFTKRTRKRIRKINLSISDIEHKSVINYSKQGRKPLLHLL